MKTTLFFRSNALRLTAFAVLALVFAGCTQKSLYDPTPDPETPPSGEFFAFSTSKVLPLTINYGINDHRVIFEIYDKNPLTIEGDDIFIKDETLVPLFTGYTDWSSSYKGTISIPIAVDKVYLFTDGFGIPNVHEVAVTASGVVFNQTISATGAATRTSNYTFDFIHPMGTAANPYNVTSPLGKWTATGQIEAQTTSTVVQGLTSRVQKIAPPTGNNSAFAKGKQFSNLVTYKETVFNAATGKVEGGTELKVKFLWEFAGYHNVLGYYYYPKGATLSDSEFKALPKYLIFPNVSWNETYAGNARASLRPDYDCIPLVEGSSVTLKYYGNHYNEPGTTVFPKDIEVGWFMMSDAFYTSDKGGFTKSNINGYLESDAMGNKTHLTYIGGGVTTGRPGSIYGSPNHLPYVYSNEEFNTNKVPGCITLYDEESKNIVIGFEDGDLRSYEDFLFYVEATPGVINPGWSLTAKIPEPTVTTTYAGALVFEDMWPSKGDYDLNDVVVNYHSNVTTDVNNNVIQLADEFTVVNDGALYTNGFGYELGLSPDAIESITINRAGVVSTFKTDAKGLEEGQNGRSVIMLLDDHKEAKGKKITVVVKIKSSAGVKLGTGVMYPPYNPFIVAESNVNKGKDRKEVHLPKTYKPTALAGKLGQEDDASTSSVWYVSVAEPNDIQYPFALNIPFDSTYKKFIPSTEGRIISIDYPGFTNWVKSNGLTNQNWYKK